MDEVIALEKQIRTCLESILIRRDVKLSMAQQESVWNGQSILAGEKTTVEGATRLERLRVIAAALVIIAGF